MFCYQRVVVMGKRMRRELGVIFNIDEVLWCLGWIVALAIVGVDCMLTDPRNVVGKERE